jgi:hypothetical protein
MQPPTKQGPPEDWEHYVVWSKIYDLLQALPNYFETDIKLNGINVTDIFAVGGLFSAVIESKIVDILNKLRTVWDEENTYSNYIFKRQAQTFPDILFLNPLIERDIILGIELKAWYTFSKESEPSFRYSIDPDACNPQDLLVVVPWYLSDIISGTPKLLAPYVEFGRYAAEYRNYHWQQSRIASGKNADIKRPKESIRRPYPLSKDEASDKADDDKGGNFGRIARTNIMNDYLVSIKALDSLGIKVGHWMKFFKAMSENNADAEIERQLDSLILQIKEDLPNSENRIQMQTALSEIVDNLKIIRDL